MRTSSNESDSDDDEYLSNKNIKTTNNFEGIKKTTQLNLKNTTHLISNNLIPCKRKFNINDNIDNINDYVSKENNSEKLLKINKSINDNINETYTIKRGKFYKSGCTLNITDNIPLKLKKSVKKTLFGKQKHRTIKLNKNINFLENYSNNNNTKNNFKENQNLIFNQKDSNNKNDKSLKFKSNSIITIPQNHSLSKLPLNFVENRNIKYPLLPSIENNFAGQNLNLKRKSDENISSINIINPKYTHNIKSLALGDAVPLVKKEKNIINFKEMSVYDRRYQSDDKPSNGNLTRVTSQQQQQNEENSTSITNPYYSSSTINAITNGNNGFTIAQPTIATLCNIGNTCYLNSVVYTLRFAPLFLHNLHHLIDDLSSVHRNIGKYRAKSSSLGRNVTGLHMENARSWSSKDLASLEGNGGGGVNNGSNNCSSGSIAKSSQQIATEKLHELYQNLHRNEILDSTEPFHADTFLHAIQDVSAIFEGNQQQDAHEFLMCVLDNIRETCQSLIKSISECPDVISNGYVSLPEQIETNVSKTGSSKDQISQTNSSSSNNISSAASQASNLIKSSFFSRKSKRKDDTKNSKNFRLHFPHKDNTQSTGINATTSDINDVNTKSHSGVNNSAKTSNNINNMVTEDDKELTLKDKEQRLAEKIKKLGLDFFTEDFEGITVSTTKCLSCETITEQKETMIDIAVPISGFENTDFSEKSDSFIQNSCITREYFRGENKYRCEQCIGYTEAIRSISYEVLPRLLVIQLSRFSGGMEKINSYLPTPFTLQCFCSKCCNKPNDDEKLHIYKLYSVITHVGATMSVGHYIAYTCSLDWTNEYVNCPKERKRQQQLNQINLSKSTITGSTNTNSNNVVSNGSSNNGTEKNVGLMKKMFYSRSKASSSGDMSKTVKNINNTVGNKDIINGSEKQQQKIKNNNIDNNNSIVCQSVNCCGTKLKSTSSTPKTTLNNLNISTNANYNNNHGINGSYGDIGDDSASNTNQNSNITGGYNTAFNNTSTIYGGNNSNNSGLHNLSGNKNNTRFQAQNEEPIWYMCDDDKIKAMTQREFEELLSPNRKIMITPYLLFYARKNYHNGNVKDGQEDNGDGIDVSGADE